MKKINKLLICLSFMGLILTGCSSHGGDPKVDPDPSGETENLDEIRQSLYLKAKEAGYEGTYEEWLQTIKGADGSSILMGETKPNSQQGKNGDIYVDYVAWDIYTKANDNWFKIGNIMGRDGEDGQDGLTPYIGQNGNWWIGEVDTGVKAEGKDGKDGQDGEDGDGKTPFIGSNGNWWIGDVDTGVPARGPQGEQGLPGQDGKDGEDGEDGLTPFIGQNGNWWIGETDTGVKAEGQDGKDGQTPTIGQNGNWWIGNVDTGIKAEGKDGQDGKDGKDGEKGDTAWSNTILPSTHGYITCNVGSALEGDLITFYAYADKGYSLEEIYLNDVSYIEQFDKETSSLTVSMVKNGYVVRALFSLTEPTPEPEPQDEYNFTIWCSESAVELTKSQLAKFESTLPEEVLDEIGDITYTVQGVSESTAAFDMINNPEKGADVYCFAQDQLPNLVRAGALDPITDPTLKLDVRMRNDSGSVSASSIKDDLYAFPLTSDNGYFMYYDKSVLTDPTDMEQIIADCENAKKEINFNYTSAWYNAGFFHAFGAKSVWTTNEEGLFIDYEDTYNSEKGLQAVKAMYKVISSPVVIDNSEAGRASSDSAVLVSGIWDKTVAKQLFGDNFAVAELPMISDGTTKKHMGSFGGFKLMGVKPQEDATRGYLAKQIANYLTNEDNQYARYKTLSWGPSNKTVQNDEDVKTDPVLSALLAQCEYAVPQGLFPGGWWDTAGRIGSDLRDLGNDDELQLQIILANYARKLDGLLDYIPEVEVKTNKVVLHYHNEDGKCKESGTNPGREFYVWASGVDGRSVEPDEVSDDGKDMSITLDFLTKDYIDFYDKDSMFLIIKYKGTWTGQSTDTTISYSVYKPDDDGRLELWITPGNGSELNIYTEEPEYQDTIIPSEYGTKECPLTVDKAAEYMKIAGDGVIVDNREVYVVGTFDEGTTLGANGWNGVLESKMAVSSAKLGYEINRPETNGLFDNIEVIIKGYLRIVDGVYRIGYIEGYLSPTGAAYNPTIVEQITPFPELPDDGLTGSYKLVNGNSTYEIILNESTGKGIYRRTWAKVDGTSVYEMYFDFTIKDNKITFTLTGFADGVSITNFQSGYRLFIDGNIGGDYQPRQNIGTWNQEERSIEVQLCDYSGAVAGTYTFTK